MFFYSKNVTGPATSIQTREKYLRYKYELRQWNDYGDDIPLVKDGLVNENEWWDTPLNVVFIVEEIDFPSFTNDISEYFSEYFSERFKECHSEFVDCILCWTHCIMHCESSMSWNKINSMMTEENNQWLLRQLSVIQAYKGNFHDDMILREQLHIYNADRPLDRNSKVPITYPNVVVCAGTANFLINMDKYLKPCYKNYISVGFDKPWNQTTYGINYIVIGETVYVDFLKPTMDKIEESSILLLKVFEEIQEKENKLLTPIEEIC